MSATEGLAEVVKLLPASPRFYTAALDALPVETYRLLDLHEPRTQAELDQVRPSVWPLLRRRLVDGFGLTPRQVDAAMSDILDQHATGNPMPRSDGELGKMREQWREAEQLELDMQTKGLGDPGVAERWNRCLEESRRLFEEDEQLKKEQQR